MARDVLRVDKVSAETKEALAALAMARYGVPNTSLLVRQLIANELTKKDYIQNSVLNSDSDLNTFVKIHFRLPENMANDLNAYAELRFGTRQQAIISAVSIMLGKPQLMNDSLEVLRQSNYQLAKIGGLLNQMAKAMNIIAKFGGNDSPEIGRKLAAFRNEIKDHIKKVSPILLNDGAISQPLRGRINSNHAKKKRKHKAESDKAES